MQDAAPGSVSLDAYRVSDFWIRRVLLDQRLINSSLLLGIARGESIIDVVKFVNV
jgi:hypothetical protein